MNRLCGFMSVEDFLSIFYYYYYDSHSPLINVPTLLLIYSFLELPTQAITSISRQGQISDALPT